MQMHLYCCLEMAKHGSVKFGSNCKLVLVKKAPILAYLTKNLIKRRAQIFITYFDIGRFGVFFVQKWKNMISRYILGIFVEESNQKKGTDFFITFYDIGRFRVFLSKIWENMISILYILGIFDEESKEGRRFFLLSLKPRPRGAEAY